MIRRFLGCKAAALWLCPLLAHGAEPPFRIEVVDRENGWPVPLVELRTTHQHSFFTDNAGVAAFDDLLHWDIWLFVSADGYEVKADGFGQRGVRATVRPGGKLRIEMDRTNIAKRMGRLTGTGLFSEMEKLGERSPIRFSETGVMGCDSIQMAYHRGKLLSFWGDTQLPGYPLGIFNMTGAYTPQLKSHQPPLVMDYGLFRENQTKLRGVADIPGEGPTWLNGLISLHGKEKEPHLVATYSKIKPPLDVYEMGLCVWDDKEERFTPHKMIWKSPTPATTLPEGHPVRHTDEKGGRWILFGDPFPSLKCPDSFEAWSDPATWEKVASPPPVRSADGKVVEVHRGSICWNTTLNKWITIFTQKHGSPSLFGEIWYAEADSPFGPWGTAVKVLSHRKHTFYNPRIDHELTPEGSPFIFFEGTYTETFSDHAVPTPRYEYNQILYRLDLDDPKLSDARK